MLIDLSHAQRTKDSSHPTQASYWVGKESSLSTQSLVNLGTSVENLLEEFHDNMLARSYSRNTRFSLLPIRSLRFVG